MPARRSTCSARSTCRCSASSRTCPTSAARTAAIARRFSPWRARACAAQYGVDFLAEIPLDIEVRETSDDGRPIVVSKPKHPLAEAYRQLALTVRDKLAAAQGANTHKFPRIVYS